MLLTSKMIALALSVLVPLVSARPLEQRQVPPGVPDYVTTYAPLVRLFSDDPYRPSDISAHLANTQPRIKTSSEAITGVPLNLTLDNLDLLNNVPHSKGGKDVYLTSTLDATTSPRPQYLKGVTPDASGKTNDAITSAIITVDKGSGIVDAFYFYFYSFDFSGYFAGINLGNHVADWEQNMIRFDHGSPKEVWLSQHSFGKAYTYKALQKKHGVRPIAYFANGTHATYPTAEVQVKDFFFSDVLDLPKKLDFPFPNPVSNDHTDEGPTRDPTLSACYYSYSPANNTFTAYDDATPTNWLYYLGQWGDAKYPKEDHRQECYLGSEDICRYVGGPNGPIFKHLNRERVCSDDKKLECDALPTLASSG